MNSHNFFAELKRRNVYKVAVAYAVVAWLLIQAASIILPTFEAPGKLFERTCYDNMPREEPRGCSEPETSALSSITTRLLCPAFSALVPEHQPLRAPGCEGVWSRLMRAFRTVKEP
jgi:hypothetical protein